MKKDNIKGFDASKGVTLIASKKKYPEMPNEVEKLLLDWINKKQLSCESINDTAIREKVRALNEKLLHQSPCILGKEDCAFKACRCWCYKFKNMAGIDSIDSIVVVSRLDAKAAEETKLYNLVAEVVEEEIQTFGRDIGLEVDADGLEDVLGQHADELVTEEILDMVQEQMKVTEEEREEQTERSTEVIEEERQEGMPTADIKDFLRTWKHMCSAVQMYSCSHEFLGQPGLRV